MYGEANGVKTKDINELYKEEIMDERINELQGRTQRCCCAYCGSELVLRRITIGSEDAGRIEIFCPNCNRIEFGVEKEIYKVADYYVDTLGFDYHQELNDSERKQRMNRAKACEIIQWGCKNLGLLKENGFAMALDIDTAIIGKDILLDDETLAKQITKKEAML